LDHLVPPELGGADGLGNIWPECGPEGVALDDRFFKRKDHVENYLAEQVRDGQMSLNKDSLKPCEIGKYEGRQRQIRCPSRSAA
jgi:hypothetical protein